MTSSMPRPAHLAPITVEIPATWTDEQALAVFELLDDLREQICARYGSRLQAALQEQTQLDSTADGDADIF